jgi:hypothetical protein
MPALAFGFIGGGTRIRTKYKIITTCNNYKIFIKKSTAQPLHNQKEKSEKIWACRRSVFKPLEPFFQALFLLDRLQHRGVNADKAPALLRDLFKILELKPGIRLDKRKTAP